MGSSLKRPARILPGRRPPASLTSVISPQWSVIRMKIWAPCVAGLWLAGCSLVDQTTFAPSPEEKPSVAPVAQADPRTPLLTIGYDTPAPDYQDLLAYAVRTAETRAPGVQYDVIAMLPAGG